MQTHSHTHTSDIELVPNRTRRFRLAEEDAGAEHEGEVDDYVDQVHQHRAQRLGMRKVVVEIADGVSAATANIAPDAEQVEPRK